MEREVRYIQLPPIPEDIEMPALEAIWLIARMKTEQRKDALEQLQAMIGDEEQSEKLNYEKVQEILEKYGEVEDESIFSQYIECFRNLFTELILESYDVAAFVYQKRCVEGLSIDDIMKNTRFTRDQLNMFVRYFDARQRAGKLSH